MDYYNFNGTNLVPKKFVNANYVNELAGNLDDYNNGMYRDERGGTYIGLNTARSIA